jgi:type VI secretion system protein ImpA
MHSGLMSSVSLDELLKPIAEGEPCGPDVGYDPAYAALETAAQGKPERFTGSTVIPAEPPVWEEVHEAALALARRTRDLRIAALLARAAARTQGLAGFLDGLSLVAGLLDQHWQCLHPRLDESAGGDATMRLNALLPLCDHATGLSDLRACGLAGHPSELTVRLIELAWTKAEPLPGEPKPTQPGIVKGLKDAHQKDNGLLERMKSVHETALRIERLLEQHVGNLAPDLAPLLRITGAVAQAAAVAEGKAAVGEAAATTPPAATAEIGSMSPGAIRSRDDVVRTLGAACEWIEHHEPSNPAPLLIRRAQRLMSKSFIDLVRDLAPEGLSQVERIAGVPAP